MLELRQPYCHYKEMLGFTWGKQSLGMEREDWILMVSFET